MIGPCNDSTQPFAKTLCSICYEDLKPIVEDLQAISICGHVFHELCIQQWFEYCSEGKKKCPICKQTCSASNVSRLYFQLVGDLSDSNLSQKLQIHKEDPEELKLEVRRLEGEISGLSLALESRENELNNFKNELSLCKEKLKKEASLKKEAMEQTDTIKRLLKIKKHELNKSQQKRNELQKRNEALNKELTALKLVSAEPLEDDEIGKHAFTEPHSKESVDKLTKLLIERNMKIKELMTKHKTLERNEACSRKELEKAKEKLKDLENLKKKIQEMETAKEMKDNEVLKAPKDSPSVLNTPKDTIKESGVHLRKTKRLRVAENIIKNTNKDGVSSVILIDDDPHPPKVSVSPESPSYGSVPQPTKRATANDDVALVHKIGQDKHLPNITNEVPLPALISQKGRDGTKSYLGKWCKRGQIKSSNASSNDSKGSSFSTRSSTLGVKTSSLQPEGFLQIGHFFCKSGQ